MNDNERDDLSELLARATPRRPSPMFVQNVVRAVRMSEPAREPGFFQWLRSGWNWAAVAGAAAVLALAAMSTDQPAPKSAGVSVRDAAAIEKALQDTDLTVINNLELLLAFDERNPWLESSLP